MLNQLHDAIFKICPIVGVADLGDNQYRIDFADDATPEQQAATWAALENFVPTEPPNWEQFRGQILINGGYLRIVASSPINQVLNSALVWTMGNLGTSPHLVGEVANLWNTIVYNVPPTQEEATAFRAIAVGCSMPFEVSGETGMITLPQV